MSDDHIDYEQILKRACSVALNELKILYCTATEIAAKNILEIGSKRGTSSMVLGTVAKEQGGFLQCIEPVVQPVWKDNMDAMGLSQCSTMIEGYSPWIDNAKINKPIDYLFIDGNHKTRWCLVDYHYLEPYVRSGGRIAFHDWNNTNKDGQSVQKAVEMILVDDGAKLREIVRDDTANGIIVFEKVKDICSRCPSQGNGCYCE